MLFQVYGENALFQWGGLIAVLLVLMLLNWYSIKSKRGAIIMVPSRILRTFPTAS